VEITVTLLDVENLSIRYGAAQAVTSLSFDSSAGQVLVLLGPNGAGKTSTLRGIMGLIADTEGSVVLDGERVSGWKAARIANAGMAMIPQGRRVFSSLTVEDNLRLGGYAQRGRKDTDPRLERCYDMFPVLRERSKQRAGYLSGGEQQMLAFGRALMSNPKVILMDEPSMGLAPIIVDKVMQYARVIADEGIGVVMVEQNAVASMKVADSVVVLNLGQEVFRGSVDESKNNPALVAAFLGESAVLDPSNASPV
jgi:branched-chain amino acid transport system ATP-binding protein